MNGKTEHLVFSSSSLLLMDSLDVKQFPMIHFVLDLVFVWSFLGAVENESPLKELSSVHVRVLPRNQGDFQLPTTMRILGPSVGGHEWPARESVLVVIIVRSLAQDHRSMWKTS